MIPNQPDVTNKIFGLDLMRVVAVLMVLGSHSLWLYPQHRNLLTKALDFSGFIGAEIFFVLSGFLIGSSLFRLYMKPAYEKGSAWRFLRRRSVRVMPNYLLILVVNLLVAAILGYSVAEPFRYFVFLQNLATPMLPFFPESWTMPVKELTYVMLPFILFGLALFLKVARCKLLLFATISLILFSVAAKTIFHLQHPGIGLIEWNIALRSVVIYRIDAVLIGIVFSYIYLQHPSLWKKNRFPTAVVGAIFMGSIVSAIALFNIDIGAFPIFWNILLLPLMSISLALFLPLLSEWKRSAGGLEVPVHFIGRISYALYLVHYSLVLFLLKYFVDTSLLSLGELHICALIYLTVSLALAWLIYTFYEKPLLRFAAMKT
ncbi:MAG: acyltransferase [Flavobacterium sp.]|nr:acyltransferase [Flavobacterium sp.]